MMLFEIEREFGVTIPLDELDVERLRTVERIAALVERLTPRAAQGR
jgi:acyl carrier protein